MNHEDVEQIRTLIREEIAPLKSDVTGIQSGMTSLKAEMTAMRSELTEHITEKMRDMQTEILRGLEAFARGNFSWLHMFDTRITSNDAQLAATNDRITALEERVLYLETRRPL